MIPGRGRIAAVPPVLECPAGANRPGLHPVGRGDWLDLPLQRDGIQLGRIPKPVDSRQHAGSHALGFRSAAKRA